MKLSTLSESKIVGNASVLGLSVILVLSGLVSAQMGQIGVNYGAAGPQVPPIPHFRMMIQTAGSSLEWQAPGP
jgi:hypothetical protein